MIRIFPAPISKPNLGELPFPLTAHQPNRGGHANLSQNSIPRLLGGQNLDLLLVQRKAVKSTNRVCDLAVQALAAVCQTEN